MLTRIFALIVLWGSCVASAAPHRALNSIENLDMQIDQTLDYLSTGNLAQARLMARMLAQRFPEFALGQLLSAELESMAAFNDVLLADSNPIDHSIIDLLLEAQSRYTSSAHQQKLDLPLEIVQAGKDVSEVVLVDLDSSILYQYDTRTNTPNLIRQHYAGSGKAGFGKVKEGDNKTPLGIYSIVDHRSDESLPELYGSGALTLDYPNALDQYLGRTGYGIWLHGVPRERLSRSPRSSEGCVTMSNEHLTRLSGQIDIANTRVILTDSSRRTSHSDNQKSQTLFRTLFNRYQRAWFKNDEQALQALYRDADAQKKLALSDHFVALGQSYPAQHFETRSYLAALAAVNLNDISIFRNPVLPRKHTTDGETNEQIVMSARFGARDEHQLTVYWANSEEFGWQVIAERIGGTNI